QLDGSRTQATRRLLDRSRREALAGRARPVTELRAIHQFTPTLTSADSISGDVFQLQRLFWRSGIAAPIYADHAAPTVRAFARDWHDLAAEPTDRAPLVVHLSMGNDSLDAVATLPQQQIVAYHNI